MQPLGFNVEAFGSSKENLAIHGQLDLEVPSESCEDFQTTFNFHEFWSEELHYRK